MPLKSCVVEASLLLLLSHPGPLHRLWEAVHALLRLVLTFRCTVDIRFACHRPSWSAGFEQHGAVCLLARRLRERMLTIVAAVPAVARYCNSGACEMG